MSETVELTAHARAALVNDLVWTEDAVEMGGGLPKTAWAASLTAVLDDVGEGAAAMGPALADWCSRKKDPPESARSLAALAVYAADDPVEVLTSFVTG